MTSKPFLTVLCGLALCVALPAKLSAQPAQPAGEPSSPRQLYLQGKYQEAVEQFTALKADQPEVAALGLARCQAAVGKYAEAEATLAAAAEQVKEQGRGADIAAQRAQLAFDRGDYEAADQLVATALAANKNQTLARWLAAELHRVRGRLAEADAGYEWFIDYYNAAQVEDAEQLLHIGWGAAEYARWHRNSRQFNFLVNTLLPDALKAEPNFWPAALESGELFLEKYNQGQASKELEAGLALNPTSAPLHTAKARLALQNYQLERAKRSLERALEINPHLLAAQQTQADLHMADFRAADAVAVLEKALPLNPVSEETLGRLAAAVAAVEGLDGDQVRGRAKEIVAQAVARNEHCGPFFFAMAASLDQLRKFPAAARYYREATERMPQLVGARGQLGLMLMRLGEEREAAELLKESSRIDPFNVRIRNMLQVLDVLDSYAVLETEHFVIKFDRGQDELLAKYAAKYLEEEVYPQLVKRLGYEPPEKSLFEIFNRAKNTGAHGWFSARMVGLPYIGTVGACAGKMVAMASPAGMPEKFNWARVLRHEFVHVVNLQQTNFNIPHWYTEALAVTNEGYPRPAEWEQILAARLAADRLFNLDTINLGFIHPASSDDWTLAYCQAQLYAEFMTATYGEDALTKMLAAYADNLETPAAIRRSFNVEQAEFEKLYSAYLKDLVGKLAPAAAVVEKTLAELEQAAKDAPDDPQAQAELAYAHLRRKSVPEARRLAIAALAITPRHPLASYVLARVYLSIGDTDKAIQLLTDGLKEEDPHEDVVLLLAALRMRGEEYAEAERLYQLGAKRFPQSEVWPKSLARVYLSSGDEEKLAALLPRLAELDTDNATLRKKLAQLALNREDHAQAVRWARETLYIDVTDAEAHATLAQAAAALEQHALAAEEYGVAVQLNARQLDWRMAQARAALLAGDRKQARQAIEGLLKIDADYEGARPFLNKLDAED